MSKHFMLHLAALILIGANTGQAAEPTKSPAGLALESIFNPHLAPPQKTMGLLQRSFLDLLESSEKHLQVAFVVDGTDSMAADIEGVRASLQHLVTDLKAYKRDNVSFALVIYRDLGSPSGEVDIPLKNFTTDEKALHEAFEKLVPESGAPYFLELPDLGVHEALDTLNWTEGNETSRWILLFGDAPPYDPNFTDNEENTGARRRFDTDLLVSLAKRKEVQINCVLCTSRPEEREVYEEVLDKTRQFMNTLSTNTDGLMLDLSYPDIRAALASAAKKQRVERQRIGTITQEDVEAAKQSAAAAERPVATNQRFRVAVVPHLPFDQMTFDPTNEAVQIATELRQKFKAMPRSEVRSPVDVERAVRRVAASKVQGDQWLQALAHQLRVDYVVWGSYRRAQGVATLRSAVYSKVDGQKVVESSVLTSDKLPETQLAGNVISRFTLAAFDEKRAPELHAAFSEVRSNPSLNEQMITPVAANAVVRSDLLTGFEALEQALAHPMGDAESIRLLGIAEQALTRAANRDKLNPFMQVLLGSCYFNHAQAATAQGRAEDAKSYASKYREALKRAYRERDRAQIDLLKTEIAADYKLLIDKDFAEAIKLYGVLASAQNEARLHTALRAHWMLAGIYSGDWGAGPDVIDPGKARGHLIQILAHWPDSPEAAFIKRHMRWDEEKGRNHHEHFPRHNVASLPEA